MYIIYISSKTQSQWMQDFHRGWGWGELGSEINPEALNIQNSNSFSKGQEHS